MGVSISVLVHLIIKRMIHFIARLNLILRVSLRYDAMPPVADNGLILCSTPLFFFIIDLLWLAITLIKSPIFCMLVC